MATKHDLQSWIVEALRALGGSAAYLEVAKHVWTDRKESGDLVCTWQYDLRWAAYELRIRGVLEPANRKLNGIWTLRAGCRL